MGLRVISTKLTEEEHSKIVDMCKDSHCNLSTFLKQCITELIEKRTKQNRKTSRGIFNARIFNTS